ncbi:Abietadienol/abietadienal oxidase [Gossypium arboreum]|uniref:Abietadienol/abietadienal oxidase n=1 Tax=Gossypium arboreum TaxID=29729 RepID=A0A0B0P6X7_GOSAR|nr:Abietadienol/abietadienal oxidase [Gossypium arboreum]
MALASYYVNRVSWVSISIPNGSTGSLRMYQRNDKYRQASSVIKVRRRHVHTIDWITWV